MRKTLVATQLKTLIMREERGNSVSYVCCVCVCERERERDNEREMTECVSCLQDMGYKKGKKRKMK